MDPVRRLVVGLFSVVSLALAAGPASQSAGAWPSSGAVLVGAQRAAGVHAAATRSPGGGPVIDVMGSGAPHSRSATAKLSDRMSRLTTLEQEHALAHSVRRQSRQIGLAGSGPGSLQRDSEGRVLVYVRLRDVSNDTLADLRGAGASIANVSRELDTVTAAVGTESVDEVAALGSVLSVEEVLAPDVARGAADESLSSRAPIPMTDTDGGPETNSICSPIISEGDTQLNAATARALYGIDGTGVGIGVLSDSYDTNASAATDAGGDVASGDLPGASNPCGRTGPVEVLTEWPGGSDEGRAMLQTVHDLAPGATLRYATAYGGELAFAEHITDLRNAGSDVIVDDVSYTDEPFFQDGPIAVAANAARAAGVVYFSSAGNSNGIDAGADWNGYEAPAYRPTTCPTAVTDVEASLDCHSFSTSGPADPTYGFTLAAGKSIQVILQWAEPRYGVVTDFDLMLISGSSVVASNRNRNVTTTQRPFETIYYTNSSGSPQVLEVAVNRWSGSATSRLKTLFWRAFGVSAVEYATPGGSDTAGHQIFGHNGSSGTVSVAATDYSDGTAVESYSSRGPVTLYYAPVSGTTPASTLGTPAVLAKPDVTATDGGQTTFFSAGSSPHRFYGTSAAAPHAAAVAALILDLNAGESASTVVSQMLSAAVPMSGGADGVGVGRIDALAASVLAWSKLPELAAGDASVVEGRSGTRRIMLPVTISGTFPEPVTVHYATVAGSAGSSDFDARSGTVTITSPGATGVVKVPIRGDGLVEGTERFSVVLSSPVNARIMRAKGRATIRDDDPSKGTRLTIGDGAVREGKSSERGVYFAVTLSRSASYHVRFRYRTVAGTAGSSDFISRSDTVAIAPGSMGTFVYIGVRGDSADEADEDFTVTLSHVSGAGAIAARTIGTATIYDDD